MGQRRAQLSGMVYEGGAVLDRHWGWPHVMWLGLGAAVMRCVYDSSYRNPPLGRLEGGHIVI